MNNTGGIGNKLRALRTSRVLKRGGCLAHATATLPGIAADPHNKQAVQQLQAFKQRQGPFLLLADSVNTALRQARYISPSLRQLARASWPGATTLIFSAKPGLHAACYQRSKMAIRVDASIQTQILAKACGGLLLSSSLNRKRAKTYTASRKTHFRFYPYVSGRLKGDLGSGQASSIKALWRNSCTTVR